MQCHVSGKLHVDSKDRVLKQSAHTSPAACPRTSPAEILLLAARHSAAESAWHWNSLLASHECVFTCKQTHLHKCPSQVLGSGMRGFDHFKSLSRVRFSPSQKHTGMFVTNAFFPFQRRTGMLVPGSRAWPDFFGSYGTSFWFVIRASTKVLDRQQKNRFLDGRAL